MMDIYCGLVVNSEITWAEMRGREMERTNGRIEVGEVTKGWGGKKEGNRKEGLEERRKRKGEKKRELEGFRQHFFSSKKYV